MICSSHNIWYILFQQYIVFIMVVVSLYHSVVATFQWLDILWRTNSVILMLLIAVEKYLFTRVAGKCACITLVYQSVM